MSSPRRPGIGDALAGPDGTQAVAARYRPAPTYADPTSALPLKMRPLRLPPAPRVIVDRARTDVVDAAVDARPLRPAAARATAVLPTAWRAPGAPAVPVRKQASGVLAGAVLAGGVLAPPTPRRPVVSAGSAAPIAPGGPYAPAGTQPSVAPALSARPRVAQTAAVGRATGQRAGSPQAMLRDVTRQLREQQGTAASRTSVSARTWVITLIWMIVLGVLLLGSGASWLRDLVNSIIH